MCFGEASSCSELCGPFCELRDGKTRRSEKPFVCTVCVSSIIVYIVFFYHRTHDMKKVFLPYEFLYVK